MSSTRASRMGTPVLYRTQSSVNNNSVQIEDTSAPTTWWAPVSRWEKQWVVPNGARAPPVLAKPLPYDVKILKYTRVMEKRRPSFVDETGSPEEASAVDVEQDVEQDPEADEASSSTRAQTAEDLEADNPSEQDIDMENDEQNTEDVPPRESASDDIDEIEQLQSTASIVEENVEILGPDADIVTAMDVDDALSHPMEMTVHHDPKPRLHSTSPTTTAQPLATSPTKHSPVNPAPISPAPVRPSDAESKP
ncbi:hypothetical protein DFJ77DRAFT_507308 [Powellomyces hirtus]|nr:hypothetical protein DFJ77DRAFT_507308 [Powellomyces hirtus]